MILKLLKNDFLQTYKTASIIAAVIVVLSFVCKIATDFSILASDIFWFLLCIITGAAYLLTLIYYNNGMFAKTGYLTNTLTATKTELLISKTTISIFWQNVLALVSIAAILFCSPDNATPVEPIKETEQLWLGILSFVFVFNACHFYGFQTFFLAITIGNTSFAGRKMNSAIAIVTTVIIIHMELIIAYLISGPIWLRIHMERWVLLEAIVTLPETTVSSLTTLNITMILVLLPFAFASYIFNIYLQEKYASI